MNIECLMKFDLGQRAKHIRSIPVRLGSGKDAILFVYSADEGVDPGEEYYHHPTDTLKLALFDGDGTRRWVRDLGSGVIPGIWFCPVLALDLNMDGADEIYFLNNKNPKTPFSFVYRKLEAIDPDTGEVCGSWDWPDNTFNERLSLCYRFYLAAGYADGKPVLITSQGTYGDMYLQGYGPGMVKLWDKVISKDEPGPRASHLTPVLDFNDDGADELFWGERLLSVRDGSEVLCCDRDRYNGHSDLVIPFVDFDTGEKFIFTCREGDERPGEPRIVTFNSDGSYKWRAVDGEGHMHFAWLATFGTPQKPRRVFMVMQEVQYWGETQMERGAPIERYFDAYTGEQLEMNFVCLGSQMIPIDVNGDGISEFYVSGGEHKGEIIDQYGNTIAKIDGEQVKNGYMLKKFHGEQLMVLDPSGVVRIFGDTDAVGEGLFLKRHGYKNYLAFMDKLMATGYNHYRSNITCGI